MDRHICSLIENSNWLDIGSISFMKIKASTPIHKAIELITINVAASYQTSWLTINRANEYQTLLYSAKIITALLIRSIMLSTYGMKEYEVNNFLGSEIVASIEYYFDYIKFKK